MLTTRMCRREAGRCFLEVESSARVRKRTVYVRFAATRRFRNPLSVLEPNTVDKRA